ncbi:MAG: 5'/3'-nucleotidase SurE [Bacteroidetes bacterium]|nr:MAG: 5'/3'-nucleotidase SurE [Bacteroidota bacterium]
MKKYRILISNDDGINALGLKRLVAFAKPFGEVTVVAPDRNHSGQSHSVTVGTPLRLNRIVEEEGYREYSCSGTPVDCVKIGLQQLFEEPPDMVLSGINHGNNAGASFFYSGTMAAAREGTLGGIPSIGFSLCNQARDAVFSACQKPVEQLLTHVVAHGLPPGITLNVNIPDLPAEAIKGVKMCRMAKGRWREHFDKRVDPYGKEYYWISGQYRVMDEGPDMEHAVLDEGYVAVVPLSLDCTAYDYLKNTSFHV